jgi:hypothetical protein
VTTTTTNPGNAANDTSIQRNWSGDNYASTGNIHDSCALYMHGGNGWSMAAEKHHRQQKVHCSNFQSRSLTISIFLAFSKHMIRTRQFAVSLGCSNVADLGARLVSDLTPLDTVTNPRLARPSFVLSGTRRITWVKFETLV